MHSVLSIFNLLSDNLGLDFDGLAKNINVIKWRHLFNRFESQIIPLNPIVICKNFLNFLGVIQWDITSFNYSDRFFKVPWNDRNDYIDIIFL